MSQARKAVTAENLGMAMAATVQRALGERKIQMIRAAAHSTQGSEGKAELAALKARLDKLIARQSVSTTRCCSLRRQVAWLEAREERVEFEIRLEHLRREMVRNENTDRPLHRY